MERCIHVYCGDGKGKTTAATGLAVRMAGCGGRVLLARFMKNDGSGELKALAQIDGIEVMSHTKSFGLYSRLSPEAQAEMSAYFADYWEKVVKRVSENDYDLVVMDEIMFTVNSGVIPEEKLLAFMDEDHDFELALTGRDPSERVVERADYVSEIHCVKHPFNEGIPARRGVEF